MLHKKNVRSGVTVVVSRDKKSEVVSDIAQGGSERIQWMMAVFRRCVLAGVPVAFQEAVGKAAYIRQKCEFDCSVVTVRPKGKALVRAIGPKKLPKATAQTMRREASKAYRAIQAMTLAYVPLPELEFCFGYTCEGVKLMDIRGADSLLAVLKAKT